MHSLVKLAFSFIREVIYIEDTSQGISNIVITEFCVQNFFYK